MNQAGLNARLSRLLAHAVLLCVTSAIQGQTPAQPPAAQTPGTQAPTAAQTPGTQTPIAAQTPATKADSKDASPAEPPEWRIYRYQDEGFSASFPAEPTRQKQSVPTEAGTLELHNYTAERGPVAFYVGVCDYGGFVSGSDPDAVLEGAKNGAIANANARLLHAKKVTLGIYPGIAFEAEADTLHLSARIYFVGSILYQIFVAGPLPDGGDDTARFLDSFQLIPRTTE